MGATPSKIRKGEFLAIESVAKYMTLTKQQMVDLRNRCYMSMDGKRKIDRRSFNINAQLCQIKECPDAEILDCLFTMWDLHGDDKILCPPFLLSIAPLACRGESFTSVMQFCLDIFSRETNGKVNPDQLIFILKHLNQTASYFGDTTLALREIYKIVDSVFETMTMITKDESTMSHKDCVACLSQEPLLQQFLKDELKKQPRVQFCSLTRIRREDGSEFSTDTNSIPLTPIARVRLHQTEPKKKKTLKPSMIGEEGHDVDISSRQASRIPWMTRRNKADLYPGH